MKTLLLPAVAAALALTACGSAGDGETVAVDPPRAATPSGIPAAPGRVHTAGLATVIDSGSPELCVGPVAESLPPQCDGLPLAGWDWADHQQMYETSGHTRWGSFLVTGTWDGTTFTYAGAIPGALYDAAAPKPVHPTAPSVRLTRAALQRIVDELPHRLPGFESAYVKLGQVRAQVTYDDGSLQRWADETYGAGVVALTSSLVAGG